MLDLVPVEVLLKVIILLDSYDVINLLRSSKYFWEKRNKLTDTKKMFIAAFKVDWSRHDPSFTFVSESIIKLFENGPKLLVSDISTKERGQIYTCFKVSGNPAITIGVVEDTPAFIKNVIGISSSNTYGGLKHKVDIPPNSVIHLHAGANKLHIKVNNETKIAMEIDPERHYRFALTLWRQATVTII